MRAAAMPFLLLAVLAGCSGSDSPAGPNDEDPPPPPPAPPEVTTLQISIDSAFIGMGDTLHLTVTVRDQYNQVMSGQQVQWTSTGPGTAEALSDGRVIGKVPGRVSVQAAVGNVSRTIPVEVFHGVGRSAPSLQAVDRAVVSYLTQHEIPGAALAVVRDGRLVMVRGYGWADPVTERAAEPTTIFRYGSISKPITSIATMMLIEQGALSLDDKPFELLNHLPVIPGDVEDPTLVTITLRQLLTHSAGWNADRAVDNRVWRAVSESGERDADQLFRYGRGVALATAPGTEYAYSNYATQTVGRLMELATGVGYEEWVQTNVFEPLGITHVKFGKTALADREPNEARYHRADGTRPDIDDGAMDYYDASGSWIGRTMDLLRLVNAVEGKGGLAPLLQPQSITSMTARPGFYPATGAYYGMFWGVVPEQGGLSWYHSGVADGAFADLHRLVEGTTYAILLNRTPPGPRPDLRAVLRTVVNWPTHDLFPLYY